MVPSLLGHRSAVEGDVMQVSKFVVTLAAGAALGMVAAMFYLGQPRVAGAASNDRYQDYVMATGAVNINARVQTDGVWMLDYKTGKLLGTVIDKSQGKVVGWAEVDLVEEFKVQPKQDVHFMMTTGYITQGQSALYLAETTTGQIGVYTLSGGANGQGIVIKRHDLATFRKVAEAPAVQPAAAPALAPPLNPLPGANPLPLPPVVNPRPPLVPGFPK